jgi:hypothetical protein
MDRNSKPYSHRPTIGLKAIHEKYFVTDDGQELIALSTLRKWSGYMQAAKVAGRIVKRVNGRKRVQVVVIEPFFPLWLRETLCRRSPKKNPKR